MLSSILKYQLYHEYNHAPVLLSSFYRHDPTFNFQQVHEDISKSAYLSKIGFQETLRSLVKEIENNPLLFRADLVDRFQFIRKQMIILDLRRAGHIVRTGPHPNRGIPLSHGDGSIGQINCDDFPPTESELRNSPILNELHELLTKSFRILRDLGSH